MCDKCDGTGLIPFRGKNGKVIPGAYTHCKCHPIYGDNPKPECYQPLKPDDFDFPCSDSFRSHSFSYCGYPDPGYVPSQPDLSEIEDKLDEIEPKTIEHIHKHINYNSDVSKKQWYRIDFMSADIQQLKTQAQQMQGKIHRLEAEKAKQSKEAKEQPVDADFVDITDRYYR